MDSQLAAMAMVGMRRVGNQRKAFWRMCGCGKQFHAIGRKRKVARKQAEAHVQECRRKSAERLASHG